MPNQPKPDFDFKRYFALPEIPKGFVPSTPTHMFINRLHGKVATF
jgi:hypothetical protein